MTGQSVMKRLLTAIMILLAGTNSLWACPMCKLALETDDPQPRAYMVSILFMMGTIFTLFGLVGAGVWWISRHERRTLEEAGYGHLFENAVNQTMKPSAAHEAG